MTPAWVAAGFVLVWAVGFVAGSRYCASRVRHAIDEVNAGLDAAGVPSAEECGGVSRSWTCASPAVAEAWAAVSPPPPAWDEEAVARLLKAIEDTPPPLCESCHVALARYLVTFPEDLEDPEAVADFFVCSACVSLVNVGAATVQELS